jgi:AbrB family looped-hinge helix DNA binding protein
MRRRQFCIIPGFALTFGILIDLLWCKTDLVKENSVVTVTVSPEFQVVIPMQVREELRIQPGQKLQILQFDDRIELLPLQNAKDMRGFLKGINTEVQRGEARI